MPLCLFLKCIRKACTLMFLVWAQHNTAQHSRAPENRSLTKRNILQGLVCCVACGTRRECNKPHQDDIFICFALSHIITNSEHKVRTPLMTIFKTNLVCDRDARRSGFGVCVCVLWIYFLPFEKELKFVLSLDGWVWVLVLAEIIAFSGI